MASKCPISSLKIKCSNTHATSSVSTEPVSIHVVHIRKISPNNPLLFHFRLLCSVVYNEEFAVGYSNWSHFAFKPSLRKCVCSTANAIWSLMVFQSVGPDRNLAEVNLPEAHMMRTLRLQDQLFRPTDPA